MLICWSPLSTTFHSRAAGFWGPVYFLTRRKREVIIYTDWMQEKKEQTAR